MSKNPNWDIDELILALNLYYKLQNKGFESTNPEVIELSKVLNKIKKSNVDSNDNTYRNPNGVAMKLGNFRRFDPDYTGKGLERGNKLEEVVWDKFFHNRAELKSVATKIEETLLNKELLEEIDTVSLDGEDEENAEASEGKVYFKLHKYFERNSGISRKKKKEVLKKTGKLKCEVCDFDFREFYGVLGFGFIECHHTKPVSKMKVGEKTKLSDLALVCSNCHRMLHKDLNAIGISDLRKLLKT